MLCRAPLLRYLSWQWLLFLAWLVHDYAEAAENMERLRFENARIGTSRHSEPPSIVLLTQLREYLAVTRVDIHQPVDADTLDGLRKIAERYASDSSLYRYAMSAAVSGRPISLHRRSNDCAGFTQRTTAAGPARLVGGSAGRHPEMKAVLKPSRAAVSGMSAR